MKTNNILIVLFILLFTGALLFSSSQALAEVNALDCECSAEEISLRACAEQGGYVIQPYVSEAYPDPIGAGEWPILNADGTKEWRYKICSPYKKKDCKSADVSTLNYFLYILPREEPTTVVDYYLSSIPPGALLLISGDEISPKCKGQYVPAESDAVKTNPSINCGGPDYITSITTTGVVQSGYCMEAYFVFSQECLGFSIRGPAFDVLPPENEGPFCDGRIVITRDPCTRELLSVEINGCESTPTAAWFAEMEGGSLVAHDDPISACGSGSGGCYVCVGSPVYIEGANAYFDNCP
jgi:hypothetical protein